MSTRILINAALGLACIVFSCPITNADPITPFVYGHSPAPGNPNELWEITPWIGSETEYVRAQTTIDNEIANGYSLTQLQSKYDAKAKQSPQNSASQFARAYCYEKCAFKYVHISDPVKEDIFNNLERTDPHHIYEFTRERFIFTVMSEEKKGADLHYLDILGRRLLAHNSSDFDVALVLYETVSFHKDLLPEGLKIAEELVRYHPNQPRAHFALAEAESAVWSYSYGNNAAAGQEAINEYQTYLKMADPADPAAKSVPFTIKAMQGYMNGQYQWPPHR